MKSIQLVRGEREMLPADAVEINVPEQGYVIAMFMIVVGGKEFPRYAVCDCEDGETYGVYSSLDVALFAFNDYAKRFR